VINEARKERDELMTLDRCWGLPMRRYSVLDGISDIISDVILGLTEMQFNRLYFANYIQH